MSPISSATTMELCVSCCASVAPPMPTLTPGNSASISGP